MTQADVLPLGMVDLSVVVLQQLSSPAIDLAVDPYRLMAQPMHSV